MLRSAVLILTLSWFIAGPGEAGECDDGIDNDGDGRFDFQLIPILSVVNGPPDGDRGCSSASDPDERSPDLACDDGIDNDGDGLTDFPDDPGCFEHPHAREDPACDDGIDNDGDGLTDYSQDTDCSQTANLSEHSWACEDGLDNDGDGKTDYPEDPSCVEASDPFETDMMSITPGVITGFACEATALDCEAEADFSVTSAVITAGVFSHPVGKGTFNVFLTIPEIVMEGSFGAVEKVELQDLGVNGSFWSPFGFDFLGTFIFYGLSFSGTAEEFDATDSSIVGPNAFSFFATDMWNNSISSCELTPGGISGRCSLFLDTLNNHPSPDTLDIGGTPHRIVVTIDPLLLDAYPLPALTLPGLAVVSALMLGVACRSLLGRKPH